MNGWRLGHADRDPVVLGSVENKQKPRKRKQEKGKKRGDWTGLHWTGGEGRGCHVWHEAGRSLRMTGHTGLLPPSPSLLHPTPPHAPPFRKAPLNLGTHFFASRTSA